MGKIILSIKENINDKNDNLTELLLLTGYAVTKDTRKECNFSAYNEFPKEGSHFKRSDLVSLLHKITEYRK